MQCADAQRQLWSTDRTPVLDAHLEGCVECRLEARRQDQLGAVLGELRVHLAAPPEGLETDLLALLERSRFQRAREVVDHPKFWRGAAVGAAAATAAAFGLIVARRLVRPDLVA